ncbi:MAG: LysR family transcriptional regulator, partial [Gammaproteobacteria bacterium]|nr:LysR family transcriptional regulator [Gammaproteobacteria bacterium]
MNIRDLRYLVAVAEFKHFGKAAEHCYVSQPTLSMQLKKLEEELEVKLFERTNKQVLVTSIGTHVVAQAKKILAELDQLKSIAATAADPLAGEFRLGAIPTVAPYLLPQVLHDIKHELPKLELYIYENRTEDILKQLRQGLLDAIILALPIPAQGLTVTELYDEPFLVALSKKNPLSKEKQINLKELKSQNLLLLEEGHCLRNQALDVCQKVGAGETNEFRATSLPTLCQMVALDMGVTLLPELAVASHLHNPYL